MYKMEDFDKDEIEDSLEFLRESKAFYTQEDGTQTTHRTEADDTQDESFYAPRKRIGWRRPTSESFSLWLLNNILMVLFCVALAYGIASFVTHYVAHQNTVEGESMEPTLSNGDSILIQKISYYFSNPKRYDVVVFPVAMGDSDTQETATYYVKRVIGLPGETVQIVDGAVYIDGLPLTDDDYCLSEILDAGNAEEPITLGEDEYFVLGDNRNMSTDSRSDYVGLVHREDIVGKVVLCIWPLSHFGLIPG